jgi:hypothetical protein
LDECSPWGVLVFKARQGDDAEPAGQRHEGRAHGVGGTAAVARSSAATHSSRVVTTQHSSAMARSLWTAKSWLSWAAPPHGRRLRLWCRCSSGSGSSSWAQHSTPRRQLQLGDGRPVLYSACCAHTQGLGLEVCRCSLLSFEGFGAGEKGDGACVKGDLLLHVCSLEKGADEVEMQQWTWCLPTWRKQREGLLLPCLFPDEER